MKGYYKYIFVCYCLLMSAKFYTTLCAQTLKASAPDVVEVGEEFRVQYTINTTDASELNAPSFVGFEVKYGPSTSTQNSIQIVNGNYSHNSSVTYTFVLTCDKPGNHTISPASVSYKGKQIKSNSLKINVIGSNQSQHTSNPNRSNNSATASGQGRGKDLFITATASSTSVYEQEAILITYKIYTLVNITDLNGKLPTLDGFQIQEIPLSHTKTFQLEEYAGRRYNAVIWTQYVVYPQKTGKLKIPAIEYVATELRENNSVDPFDAFFNGISKTEHKRKVIAPSITIDVKPLPQRPTNFSGGVGHFTLTSSISSKDIKTNDALTIRIRLKGQGNMKLIKSPELKFPKSFETYDVKINDDSLTLDRGGVSGTKVFEYLAVPRRKGTFVIPSAEFIFYDTKSKQYQTLTTQPYTIYVKQGKSTDNNTYDYAGNNSNIKDIQYIKTGEVNENQYFVPSALCLVLIYIGVTVLLIFIYLIRRHITHANSTLKGKERKANKIAVKRLKYAIVLLHAGKRDEFYDEVMRALWNYASDKLHLQPSQINKENITKTFMNRGVDDTLSKQFISCLDACEFARYAPGDPYETMDNVYNMAVEVISELSKTKENVK